MESRGHHSDDKGRRSVPKDQYVRIRLYGWRSWLNRLQVNNCSARESLQETT